jgi:hypothetical protein
MIHNLRKKQKKRKEKLNDFQKPLSEYRMRVADNK